MPLSLVTVCFEVDENLAFLIRTAVCCGIGKIFVIGKIPSRSVLKAKSGSMYDLIELIGFSSPIEFAQYARDSGIKLIAAEIGQESESLYKYKFNFDTHSAIILGNERTGVPVELIINSDTVHMPMLGLGACLNTSQTGTAFVTEYVRQYLER